MISAFASRAAAVLVLLVSMAALAAAQQVPEAREGDTVELHTVEAGETLSSITYDYLGDSYFWRENWRLNPDVQDPDLLRIGQRLRIITARKLDVQRAEIVRLKPLVEKRRVDQDADWVEAFRGDLLEEQDGLSTEEGASAGLRFGDGAELTVTENSRVFLRRIGVTLRGVKQETIEIDRGQADLSGTTLSARSSEIEIIVGDTRTKPSPDSDGRVANRLRKDENQAARLMVYQGRNAVEAAGQRVDLGAGMGTSVPQGGPPAPPEVLLGSPRASSPAEASAFGYSNPLLSWNALDGAARYTVEVCFDAECGRYIARGVGVIGTSWRPPALPVGSHFWRVRGVSGTGLDGYASRPRNLVINDPTPDLQPPAVGLALAGPGDLPAAGNVDLAFGGALVLEPTDDASGLQTLRFRWNGGDWRVWSAGTLLAPPGRTVGSHRLELETVDAAGRTAAIDGIDVTQHPRPPKPSIRAGRQQ